MNDPFLPRHNMAVVHPEGTGFLISKIWGTRGVPLRTGTRPIRAAYVVVDDSTHPSAHNILKLEAVPHPALQNQLTVTDVRSSEEQHRLVQLQVNADETPELPCDTYEVGGYTPDRLGPVMGGRMISNIVVAYGKLWTDRDIEPWAMSNSILGPEHSYRHACLIAKTDRLLEDVVRATQRTPAYSADIT